MLLGGVVDWLAICGLVIGWVVAVVGIHLLVGGGMAGEAIAD